MDWTTTRLNLRYHWKAVLLGLLVFLIGILLWPSERSAYVLEYDHPSTVTLNLRLGCPDDPSQIEAWGPCWDDVVTHAMNAWNAAGSHFRFQIASPSQTADPCDDQDGISTVGWSPNLCGITDQYASPGSVLGTARLRSPREFDVVFNSSRRWRAHRESRRYSDPNLYHVALHELGHVVGLGHPNRHGQSVVSVMNTDAGWVVELQPDDIQGAIALHGSASSQPLNRQAGVLESPAQGALVSGIGFISGWKCRSGPMTAIIDNGLHTYRLAREQLRTDTRSVCGGKMDNGFITQLNWNHLGAGTHTIVVYDNGEEFARSTFTVGSTGEEFLRGVSVSVEVPDFPAPGETGRFRWSEATQHLELVEVVNSGSPLSPQERLALFNGGWNLDIYPERNCHPARFTHQEGTVQIANGRMAGKVETHTGPFSNVAQNHDLTGTVEASGQMRMTYAFVTDANPTGRFTGTLDGGSGLGAGRFDLEGDSFDPLCVGRWEMQWIRP